MRFVRLVPALAVYAGLWFSCWQTPAQQVTVSTPYHTLNDSFFERIGVDFDFNLGGRGTTPFMLFGRPYGDPSAGTPMMRNMLDTDGGRSTVVGMLAPGVFSPDLGIPFNQNSYGLGVPQFGGYDPSAGLTSGFHLRHGNFNGSLNWTASQGYRQTFTSQTPSVTLTNGVPGSISDTSQSPFVIGFIPIVGGFPTVPTPFASMPNPVPEGNHRVQAFRRQMAEKMQAAVEDVALRRAAQVAAEDAAAEDVAAEDLARPVAPPVVRPVAAAQKLAAARSSSAGRAVPSVAEARRLRKLEQAAQDNEAMVLFERGRTAEEGGKGKVAKVYYKMAAGRASGELRQQIQARLDALSTAGTP